MSLSTECGREPISAVRRFGSRYRVLVRRDMYSSTGVHANQVDSVTSTALQPMHTRNAISLRNARGEKRVRSTQMRKSKRCAIRENSNSIRKTTLLGECGSKSLRGRHRGGATRIFPALYVNSYAITKSITDLKWAAGVVQLRLGYYYEAP
jgi:hypothetical protein